MKAARYRSACAVAGSWLEAAALRAGPLRLGDEMPAGPTSAKYIVCDGSGRILYVGSTRAGLRSRLRQHCADWERTKEWAEVWVVLLKPATPLRERRRIEGLIGRALGPAQSPAFPHIS